MALAVVALLALLGSSPASAAKRELRPASVGKHVITFELRDLKPRAIRKATLYTTSATRRIGRSAVRRAARSGRLKVRRASRRSSRSRGSVRTARKARLVIVTDTTPPRAVWRKLGHRTAVSGVLTAENDKCAVNATDNVGVSRVDFYLNGKRIGRDRRAPFTCRWDTRTAMNGGHRLSAVAVDGAGQTTNATVAVLVHRSGSGATTPPAFSPSPPPRPPPGPGPAPFQTLVFEENFNGTSVDTTQWSPYHSPGHAGNGLRRASAFSVANGLLDVAATWDGANIVSGGMAHRSNYKYGRFEFRVRTDPDPTGQTSGVVLTWPQSNRWIPDGENDIYETGLGKTRYPFHSYIHYNTDGRTDRQYAYNHYANGAQWHTMRMDWTPSAITLYRDGVHTSTLTDAQAIRDVPHHMSIQLDAFSNRPLAGPVKMQVDWVKIYQ